MSIVVNMYPSTPYRLTPVAWPVKIFDPPTIKPVSTMLQFNWLVYFAFMNNAPNIAVNVDLNSGGTSQGPVLDKIVCVKIDNSNSFVPIIVYFPDSGDIVSCAPQTIVTLPCTTNGSTCKVIAQGLSAGNTPQTVVTFFNYFIPPSIDPVLQLDYPQYLGSPSIQRNASQILTPGYGSPALGDQTVQTVLFLSLGPLTQPIFTPQSVGFFTVVAVALNVFFVTNGATALAHIFFESTGSAGILYDFGFGVTTPPGNPILPLANITSVNLKLDATQQWQLRIPALFLSGFASLIVHYTYNPNF